MSWRYDEFSGYPRSQPRAAKGGIKAQAQRGAFGTTWWAKRWIAVLEGFDLGPRLTRGKSYARSGQVLTIDVSPGRVTAQVQGSRPTPYAVTIGVRPLSAADWRRVGRALGQEARFAATLLAGQMPQDIEAAFRGVGLSLFPERLADLDTACSCPDWSNPCKHIAAVYYLLGEEFDRDPFLLFTLRGLSREDLLALLAEAAPAAPTTPASATEPETPASLVPEVPTAAVPSEPVPAEATTFWGSDPLPEDLTGPVSVPPVTAPVLRRLGAFPFWRGPVPLLEALAPHYGTAAQRGLDVVAGTGAR